MANGTAYIYKKEVCQIFSEGIGREKASSQPQEKEINIVIQKG